MENKNNLVHSIEAEPIDPLDPLQYDQEVHNIQQQETEVPVAEPLEAVAVIGNEGQEVGTFCNVCKSRRTRIFVILSAILLTTTIATAVTLFIVLHKSSNNNVDDNDQPSTTPSFMPSMSPTEASTEASLSLHPSPAPTSTASNRPSAHPSMTVWNDGWNPNLLPMQSPYFQQGQVSAEGAIYGMESNGEQSSKIRLQYHNDVIANDHYWTTYFSDENNGSQQTCNNEYPLVSQIQCSSSHTRCDTLRLRCSKVKDNYKVIVSSKKDRDWFSDEQADFAYCPGGYQYLYGLGCSGENCDNIQMKCVKVQYSS